ncbi:MAG: peptidoglycan-binding protein [Acutalibacteraceae bacterium]|nr:peptidoglycan-binding protein [Acutalibacteraceae bacterium]
MFKKIISFSLSIAMLTVISGCDISSVSNQISEKISIGNKTTDYPVQVGRDKINSKPKKVLVLDDNVADILIACGYTDKIVGCSTDCTQAELTQVKKYGSDINPRTDIISQANADIIFASPDVSHQDYKDMKESGTVVLRIAPANSIESLDTLYSNICTIMSGNLEGDRLGTEYAQTITDNIEKANSNTVVKGCYIYDVDTEKAVTNDMFENDILKYAGVQNIATDLDVAGALPVSKILASDKQQGFAFYILCEKGMKDKILQSNTFKNANVVNKNRVIEIPSEYLSRQGNSAVGGISYISKAIQDNKNRTGKSLTEDYGIEIFDGMSYTLDEENSYVLAIQQRLKDLGYLYIEPTGFFGQSTADAVKAFQINNELNRRDGVADKETIERLFSTLAFSAIVTTTISDTAEATTEASTTATEAPTIITPFE